MFAAVAAFSVGVVPQRISGRARAAGVRHYRAAGTLEPGFRQATRQWADQLHQAGRDCRYQEWVGAVDQLWWAQQLPAAPSASSRPRHEPNAKLSPSFQPERLPTRSLGSWSSLKKATRVCWHWR